MVLIYTIISESNIYTIIDVLIGISCQSNDLSNKIRDKILKNYDKSKHIIENVSNTTVKLGISIIHLDVDEKNRILISDIWTRLKWIDKELTWKPKDFGNVSNIKVNYDSIWTPDITLYNRYVLKRQNYPGQKLIKNLASNNLINKIVY